MNILPLENRVLVELEKEKETQTEGGLYVPGTYEKNTSKGKVLAVGPGKLLASGSGLEMAPPLVQVGDTVLVRRGTGLDLDGLFLFEEYEILAKVK